MISFSLILVLLIAAVRVLDTMLVIVISLLVSSLFVIFNSNDLIISITFTFLNNYFNFTLYLHL